MKRFAAFLLQATLAVLAADVYQQLWVHGNKSISFVSHVDASSNTVILIHVPAASKLHVTNNAHDVGDCSCSTLTLSIPRTEMRSGDNNFVVTATVGDQSLRMRAILEKPQ